MIREIWEIGEEGRRQKPEARSQEPEAGSQKPEEEAGSRKKKPESRMRSFPILASDFCLLPYFRFA
jgi:hypothetical protein